MVSPIATRRSEIGNIYKRKRRFGETLGQHPNRVNTFGSQVQQNSHSDGADHGKQDTRRAGCPTLKTKNDDQGQQPYPQRPNISLVEVGQEIPDISYKVATFY